MPGFLLSTNPIHSFGRLANMMSAVERSRFLLALALTLLAAPTANAGFFSGEYHFGASYFDRAAPRNLGLDVGILSTGGLLGIKGTEFMYAGGNFSWQPGNPDFFDFFTHFGFRILRSPTASIWIGFGFGMGGPYGTNTAGLPWAQILGDAFSGWLSGGFVTGAHLRLSGFVGLYGDGSVRWRASSIDKQPYYRFSAGLLVFID